MPTRACAQCGAIFHREPSQTKFYCSRACVVAADHTRGTAVFTVGGALAVAQLRQRKYREADATRPPRPACACGRGEVLPSRPQCGACYQEGRALEGRAP